MKNNKLTLIVTITLLVSIIGSAYFVYDMVSSQVETPQVAQSSQLALAPQTESSSGETVEQTEEPDPDVIMAPDFVVYDIDGNPVNLSDFEGKPVVINYWASWCPPCIAEFPDFELAYQEYGEEVVFLMVNSTDGSRETVDSATEFIDENGYTMPIVFDSDLNFALTYQFRALPTTTFINGNGEIFSIYSGLIGKDIIDENIQQIII